METDILLPEAVVDGSPSGQGLVGPTGVLPCQDLERLIERKWIRAEAPFDPSQIQPASLDLRLSGTCYRVPASFLPGPTLTVAEKLERLAWQSFSLEDGAILEKNCTYIVPLQEMLELRSDFYAFANPKSSIGRLDIFARVIADRGVKFDHIDPGYKGRLYVELSPRTFSVRVRKGSRLVQLRIRRGRRPASEQFHLELEKRTPLVKDAVQVAGFSGSRPISVDLEGHDGAQVVGYRARKSSPFIDVDCVGQYAAEDFWDPLYSSATGLILEPGEFYILASREDVAVDRSAAAELIAYDTLVGEFRVHYAGFFDPGFGVGAVGTKAVLEVRCHEVPFLVEHGQVVGRLIAEPMTQPPERLYGAHVGTYQGQGLKLAKQFRPWGGR